MSKNNFEERLRKMQPKQDRYAIRKFTIGAASVLIGISFLALAGGQTVHADSTGEQPEVEQVASQKDDDQADANEQTADNTAKSTPAATEGKEQTVKKDRKQDPSASANKQENSIEKTKTEKQIAAAKGDANKKQSISYDLSKDNQQAGALAEQKNVQSKVEQATPNKAQTDDKQELKQAKLEPATKSEQGQKDNDSEDSAVLEINADDFKKDKGLNWLSELFAVPGNCNIYSYLTFENYHKTNDGSEIDPEINQHVPQIYKIVWISNDTTPKQTLVYERQSDGSYLLTSGAGFGDASGQLAPTRIPAGQVTTAWEAGYKGNSDFGKDTATSLAEKQLDDPHGDQRTGGWFRFWISVSYGPEMQAVINDNTRLIQSFNNYYGAVASNTNASFKQNQDLAHLSQADFRKIVDVSELGHVVDPTDPNNIGWNGVNVDSASAIGHNAKAFWMTWKSMPSTSTVANNVAGTVRINFNDGTWLDVPVKIDVKNENNDGSDQPTNPNPTPNPNPQPTKPMPTPAPAPQPTAPNNDGQKTNADDSNVKPKAAKTVTEKKTNKVAKKTSQKLTKAAPSAAKRGAKSVKSLATGPEMLKKSSNSQRAGNGPETTSFKGSKTADATNKGNGQQVKSLPQTGAAQKQDGVFSVFGLALASLAGLFAFGGDRKRDKH